MPLHSPQLARFSQSLPILLHPPVPLATPTYATVYWSPQPPSVTGSACHEQQQTLVLAILRGILSCMLFGFSSFFLGLMFVIEMVKSLANRSERSKAYFRMAKTR